MTNPTPEAYEAACHALERHRARANEAQARANELQQLLDLKNEQQHITSKCCCNWGAAVGRFSVPGTKGNISSDEWPEFDCSDCPFHGGEQTQHTCKRHKKLASDIDYREEITEVIRDTIWRIHGPDSTDEEGAEMDAENIVCALDQSGLLPQGNFEKEIQFGWVAENNEVIQFATHKPEWPDVPSIRVNGKVRRVMKRTKITGISRWIEINNA